MVAQEFLLSSMGVSVDIDQEEDDNDDDEYNI